MGGSGFRVSGSRPVGVSDLGLNHASWICRGMVAVFTSTSSRYYVTLLMVTYCQNCSDANKLLFRCNFCKYGLSEEVQNKTMDIIQVDPVRK